MSKWSVTEPGNMVLNGTPYHVTFDPSLNQSSAWRVMRGDTLIYGLPTLESAKRECERRQSEMAEVGLE
jgi:hypothetical protein